MALIFSTIFSGWVNGQPAALRKMSFDNDWLFYRGNDSTASQPNYDDSKWRKTDLPHDWSIEDLPGTQSPFNADAVNGVSVGFTTAGTGWYRKSFTIPAQQKGKRVIIEFDGVYMNADIWVNGKHVGNHPYGYTSFYYDITGQVIWDQKNIIAVEVKNEGKNSRWYAGSGIYRHVWLNIFNPIHIANWGTSITTTSLATSSARVHVKTKVQNEASGSATIQVVTKIIDEKGIEKAKATTSQVVSTNETHEVDQSVVVSSPTVWSIENPALYHAKTEIYQNNKLLDAQTTAFGIRTISFDAVNGFRLNGKTIKLKGGCVHHDNGPLGAKAYDRAEERKVQLLKASGFNAVRCSHNPPSPAFLDACDKYGMLVIDEAFDTWNQKKNKDDYNLYFKEWWQRDLQSMVYRDRNHPSVIMWSIGNEIPDRSKPEVAAVSKMLADYVRGLDNTRAITAGVNGINQRPDAFIAPLDVAGYNYAVDQYVADHQRLPERVMMATESFALEAFDYWQAVEEHPWVIGDFIWTAFDYIGEASIGWLGYPQSKTFYPWNLAYCGDIDICGWKRPQSFYRDALWKKDQLSIFVKPPEPTFKDTNSKHESWSKWNSQDVVPDWNWKSEEGKSIEVNVYSSCDEVELFLNGNSLGKRTTNVSDKFITVWQVPYNAGILKAIGYTGNKQVAESILQTAEEASKIKLTPDRTTISANGQDLSYVTVELTDANGVRNPKANDLVKFTVEGSATIAGVANADPKSIESFQLPQRKAWQGKCLVVLKSDNRAGTIKLKASVPGMKDAETTITSKK